MRDLGMGARLFGYTKLYGEVPGGQAEYLRVPLANFNPIKAPEGPHGYEIFQKKDDAAIKVLLKP